jgi:hypothetical protein
MASNARIGGIALVGVGVVAAVIGLVSLGTGGGSSSSSEAAPETASVAPATPDTNAVPLPSFSPTPTTAAPATTPAAVAPPVAAAAPEVAPTMPLRVYNNSTITGLAATASSDFQRGGWTVSESRNYPDGIIPTSTVYYRPGTGEEASAQRLADEYGLRVEPRFEGIQDASPGLIVIVTRDFKGA